MPSPPSRSDTREQLIDEALAIFQPLSPEPLSREDGREFVDDLTGLFDWLLEQREKNPVPPPRPAVRRDPSAPPLSDLAPAGADRPEPRPRRRANRQE